MFLWCLGADNQLQPEFIMSCDVHLAHSMLLPLWRVTPRHQLTEKDLLLFHRRETDRWVVPFGAVFCVWLLYTACNTLSRASGDSNRPLLDALPVLVNATSGIHLGATTTLTDRYRKGSIHYVDGRKLTSLYQNGILDDYVVSVFFSPIEKNVQQLYSVTYPGRLRSSVGIHVQPDRLGETFAGFSSVYLSRQSGWPQARADGYNSANVQRKYNLTNVQDAGAVLYSSKKFRSLFKSIYNGWPFLLFSTSLSLIWCLTYALFILPFFASWVMWITWFVAPLQVIAATIYLIYVTLLSTSYDIHSGETIFVRLLYYAFLIMIPLAGIAIGFRFLWGNTFAKRCCWDATAVAQSMSHCLRSLPFSTIICFLQVGTLCCCLLVILSGSVIQHLVTSSTIIRPFGLSNPLLNATVSTTMAEKIMLDELRTLPLNFTNADIGVPRSPKALVPSQLRLSKTFWYSNKLSAASEIHLCDTRLGKCAVLHVAGILTHRHGLKANITSTLQRVYGSIFIHCTLWIIGTFWLIHVINSTVFVSICLVVAVWYFTPPNKRGRRPSQHSSFPPLAALWISLRYHLGTLYLAGALLSLKSGCQKICSGLLFVALCCFPQVCTAINTLTTYSGCLGTLSRQAKFLVRFNHPIALVETALHSTNFIPASTVAYKRMQGYTPSLMFLYYVHSLLAMIPAFGLALTLAASTVYIASNYDVFRNPTSSWYIEYPLTLGCFGFLAGIGTSQLCLEGLNLVANALLYCFLVDREEGEGKSLFAPDPLRALVEEQEAEQQLRQSGYFCRASLGWQ